MNIACEKANNGILKMGLRNFVFRYLQTESKVITQICDNWNDLNMVSKESIQTISYQRIISIQIVFLKFKYIDVAMSLSYDIFKNHIEEYFSQLIRDLLIKFIIFVLIMIFMYFIILKRLINDLIRELKTIKGIISLIPTKLLENNKNLKTAIFSEKI